MPYRKFFKLAVLLLVFPIFGFNSPVFSQDFTQDSRNAIIDAAVKSNDWKTPVKRLVAELAERSEDGSVPSDWSSTLHLVQVMQWLGRNEMEQKLNDGAYGSPDRTPRNQLVAQRLKPDTLTALLKNTALVDSLAVTELDSDYRPGVFSVLGDLQESHTDQMESYASLAVALAVVYDVNIPDSWPHHQVKRENVTPYHWNNWVPLFDYFVQENEDQHLLVSDIKEQPASILKFMVDAPLAISELKWAAANVGYKRTEFYSTFFLVPYDNARLNARQYDWSAGDYTLANIERTGGICVDQAYFACIAGKARGLPTIYLFGVGADGYHAWFGYQDRNNSWNLNAGRYPGEGFLTGTGFDPQTWEPVSDHQIAFDTRQVTTTNEYQFSQDLLNLAKLENVTGLTGSQLQSAQLQLIQQAQKVCPENYYVWTNELALLKEMKSPDIKTFLDSMLDQFQGDPDLKNKVQSELMAASKNDAGSQEDLTADMTNPQDGRVDVSVQNESDIVLASLDKATDDQSLSDAIDAYKEIIHKHSNYGTFPAPTGVLLDKLVRPFVLKLIASGKNDDAKTCLLYTEKYLAFTIGTQIDDEFRKLDKQVDINR